MINTYLDTEEEKKKYFYGNKLIVKSNALIEARYKLSLQEFRIILWLLTQITPQDEDFKRYKLSIKEFAAITNVKVDAQYKELRKITKTLTSRSLSVYDPDKETLLHISWLSAALYQLKKGIILLEFSPYLKPYLLQVKNRFTKFSTQNFLKLRSTYSIRIFELLKQYKNIGERQISIEDLRAYCGISPLEYKNYNAIKLYVMERAKTEINAKTEYEVNYDEIKASRKVIAINWTIKKQSFFEKTQSHKAAILAKEYRSELALVERMMEYGFARLTSKNFIQNHGEEVVKNALRSVDLQVERGHVKNPKAMLQIAIKDKWHPEKYIDRKKKRG